MGGRALFGARPPARRSPPLSDCRRGEAHSGPRLLGTRGAADPPSKAPRGARRTPSAGFSGRAPVGSTLNGCAPAVGRGSTPALCPRALPRRTSRTVGRDNPTISAYSADFTDHERSERKAGEHARIATAAALTHRKRAGPDFRLVCGVSGSGFPGGRQGQATEWRPLRPWNGAMEKLRRVLSGQDDEEQGLTAQVANLRPRPVPGLPAGPGRTEDRPSGWGGCEAGGLGLLCPAG